VARKILTNRGENGDELELGGEKQRRKNGPLGAEMMRFYRKIFSPGWCLQPELEMRISSPGWRNQSRLKMPATAGDIPQV
jgi:hypothetical protein